MYKIFLSEYNKKIKKKKKKHKKNKKLYKKMLTKKNKSDNIIVPQAKAKKIYIKGRCIYYEKY